jgi:hypothetical protein
VTKRIAVLLDGATVVTAGTGVAAAQGGGSPDSPSRLDDGKDLLSQSTLSEAEAITAAQNAADGTIVAVDKDD